LYFNQKHIKPATCRKWSGGSVLARNSRIFLLSFLLIILSCSTVSPLGPSVSFADIEVVQPVWHQFEDGIGYFHGTILNPQLEFWALRLELGTPENSKLKIVIKEENLSTKVSSFVRDNNLLAGINTAPFDIITAREGEPIKNIGIIVSNGVLITPINTAYDALVFYKDGRAAIVRQSTITSIENIENAAGGFHQILASGEPAGRTLRSDGVQSQRHPRSAAGVSANGNILFLLVIDGRRAASTGSTELETAMLLRILGSWDGINFDGGGSSTLALRYPDGNVRTVNTPVHGGFPGQERAVAGCLGISLSTEK
jgi:hypothetical protein